MLKLRQEINNDLTIFLAVAVTKSNRGPISYW